MTRKYSKFLTITLIIIIVAVIGLLAYLGYDYYSKYRTVNDNADAADALINEAVATPEGINTPVDTSTADLNTDQTTDTNNTLEPSNTTNNSTSNNTKTKPMYKGFYMVGTIEIPKISLKYTVLEKVTDKSLKTSVAVEWPQPDPVLNEVGNVVIAGHNYRNGVFFSNLKKLSKGDKIYLTDLQKRRVAYVIYNLSERSDTDTELYNKNTNGKREVTLKTCTDDGSKRLFIEAREE